MLAAGSLSSHMMTQHGRAAEIRRQWITPAAGIVPQTYSMSFPAKGGPRKFPLVGFPGRVREHGGIWENMGDIRQRYSTQTMSWLPRLTPNVYRAYLTPCSAYLTGWACRQFLGRQSEWSVTPVRRRVTYLQQLTGGGSRGWDIHTWIG